MNTSINKFSARLEEFDIGKGIAIFLVVIGHLLEQTFCVGEEIQRIIVFCHMPVFFFISGFFLNYSVQKYSKITILKNKARQLIIPFICWSTISFVANIMLTYKNEFFIGTIKNQFFEIFVCARSVWFLIVLFTSQAIFLGILYLSERVHVNQYIALFAGWLLISFIIPNPYLSMYKFKWLFPFLIIGSVYSEKREKLTTIIQKLKKISFIFPIVCLMVNKNKYYNIYLEFKYSDLQSIMVGITYYFISLMGILFIFELSTLLGKTKLKHELIDCGRYSLEIYVMHMFFIKFIVFIPLNIIKNNVLSLSVGIILYAIVIVALIILLSKYILKNSKIYNFSVGKNKNEK